MQMCCWCCAMPVPHIIQCAARVPRHRAFSRFALISVKFGYIFEPAAADHCLLNPASGISLSHCTWQSHDMQFMFLPWKLNADSRPLLWTQPLIVIKATSNIGLQCIIWNSILWKLDIVLISVIFGYFFEPAAAGLCERFPASGIRLHHSSCGCSLQRHQGYDNHGIILV